MERCNNEVIDGWLNYIDNELIPETSELGLYRKTFVLDSIEVLNFIRTCTDDIPTNQDDRLQFLIDLCLLPCRNDYYQRFLGFNSKYYRSENDWWVDCWQSIRLNNILHELGTRSINYFVSEESDGKYFGEKWKVFFVVANNKKANSNSLPAFSYLECIRLLTNLGIEPPINDLNAFLRQLSQKRGNKLVLFPMSTEIRAQAINLIDLINEKFSGKYDFDEIYSNLIQTLKEILINSDWNKYSNSWAPILIKISKNGEILNLINSKIPSDVEIDSRWITGSNFTNKPRFALLSIFPKLNDCNKYFEVIEPNRFVFSSYNYINNYVNLANIIDRTVQSFDDNRDLHKKVQDNEIREDYFRDLLKIGISSNIGNDIKWVEKEREVGSGRITDVLITVEKGPNIPIEAKILWRFREGYNPLIEVLEQTNKGNLGITFIINPIGNPLHQEKYQGFEGWKNYIEDHDTYVPGTIRDFNKYFELNEELKTRHLFSDHRFNFNGRTKNITLLHFFIDLQDYIRSPSLSKLK